jgi:WD40 repeat protein
MFEKRKSSSLGAKINANSFINFCPKCKFFEEQSGVCKKLYFNVRDYPKKFIKKCNGEYYAHDVHRTFETRRSYEVGVSELSEFNAISLEQPETLAASDLLPSPRRIKYKGFISYKHSERNREHAIALESALKKYARSWLKPPLKIYRDETQAVAGDDLPSTIKEALSHSEFLIYLASKESAQSDWVNYELRYWCLNLKRVKKLIIVHLDDRIEFDLRAETIDWAKSSALPKVLEEHLEGIPFIIDLTWATNPQDMDQNNLKYRNIINNISALFRGITPEEMNGEEIKTYRKNKLIKNLAIGIVCTFAVVAMGAAYFANEQRKLARTNEQKAITAADIAILRLAEVTLEQDPTQSTAFLKQLSFTDHFGLTRQIATAALRRGIAKVLDLQKDKKLLDINYSSDSEILAICYKDGQVDLVDVEGGNDLFTLQDDSLEYVIFPNGDILLTIDKNEILKLWDLKTRQPQRLTPSEISEIWDNGKLKRQKSIISVSPGGDRFAWFKYTDYEIEIWKDPFIRPSKILKNRYREPIKFMCFSLDGGRLATCTESGTIIVHDFANDEEHHSRIEADEIFSFAFSPDGKTVAISHSPEKFSFETPDSSSSSWELSIWTLPPANSKVVSGRLISKMENCPVFRPIYFDKSGKSLISFSLSNEDLYIVDFMKSLQCKTIETEKEPFSNLTIFVGPQHSDVNYQNNLLAKPSRREDLIRVWHLGRKQVKFLRGHSNAITNVKFSPDGRSLSSVGHDNSLRIWDIQNLFSIVKETPYDLRPRSSGRTPKSLSPDQNLIVFKSIGNYDNSVGLWNPLTDFNENLIFREPIVDVSITKKGDKIAWLGKENFGLFQLDSTRRGEIITGAGIQPYYQSIGLSMNGKWVGILNEKGDALFTKAGSDTAYSFWLPARLDTTGIDSIALAHTCNSLIDFSPDETVAVMACADDIQIIDLSNFHVDHYKEHTGYINDIAFSPDSDIVASADSENSIRIWNYRTLDTIQILNHRSGFFAVVFSPDGRRIYSTGGDHAFREWDLISGKSQVLDYVPWPASSLVGYFENAKMIITVENDGTAHLFNDPLPSDNDKLRKAVESLVNFIPKPPSKY